MGMAFPKCKDAAGCSARHRTTPVPGGLFAWANGLSEHVRATTLRGQPVTSGVQLDEPIALPRARASISAIVNRTLTIEQPPSSLPAVV